MIYIAPKFRGESGCIGDIVLSVYCAAIGRNKNDDDDDDDWSICCYPLTSFHEVMLLVLFDCTVA